MKHLALGVLLTTASPAFAFYQDMACERNTVTGAMELDPQTIYVARQWDSYRIVAEQDRGITPQPAISGRKNWVAGICAVEGRWSKVPEEAPIRFPRQ